MSVTNDISCGRAQRVLVYCHDSAGVGHLRRTQAICGHLSKVFPAASFLIATGTPYVSLFKFAHGVDYFKLPSLAKENNGTYHSKYLGLGLHQLMKCRRAMLLSAVQYFRPTVVLVDKAPVGVRGEMAHALRWIQRNRPQTRVIFGMRDIEDAPEVTIRQWEEKGATAVLEECYDEVWVYGMESVFDVAREYRLSPDIRRKLRYTGYIGRPTCSHEVPAPRGHRQVLVTVGGGTDGRALLNSYLSDTARRVAEAGGHSTLIGGPDLPVDAADRFRGIVAGLPNTTWIDSTRCLCCHMRQADAIVCMGGYNTLCEVVALQKSALVIPRVQPRQEQAIRARRWERLGLVRTMGPSGALPEQLAVTVMDMLERPTVPDRARLDLSGLDRIAERFQHYFSGVRSTAQ